MQNQQLHEETLAAMRAAVAAGLARFDIARITGVPIETPTRADMTSHYEVKYFGAGQLHGMTPGAAPGPNQAGWHIHDLRGKPVPAAVRQALAELVGRGSGARG